MKAKIMKKFFGLNSPKVSQGEPKKKRKLNLIKVVNSGVDIPFLFLVLTILIVGLVMMFSASYPYAYYHNHICFHFIRS